MRSVILSLVILSIVACVAIAQDEANPQFVKGKYFDRVFIIIFENHSYKEVMADPYFNKLASMGLSLSNNFANFHPSEPNYIALTYGSNDGIVNDGNFNIPGNSIVDLLEEKGVSWKAYMESYPGKCFAGTSSGTYVRKHNPFISYENVYKNASLCAKIVDSTELSVDQESNSVPQYSWYTPDMNNDAHDTSIAYASKWLQGFFPTVHNDPNLNNTAFILTWDEDDGSEGNQIYTVFVGMGVKPGSTDNTKYDHYSLLRTIEDNFGLGTLGRDDASAKPIGSLIEQ
ncbi:hypothetical protein SAMD00019534_050370 [Acytostelium subglobosum LB1]|uniref:hypothetical protein n=1 Tax=Acytostelium subglobosum LB1 TaxID=1410327 RepID=UPI000644B552|nr:hypothetical protein SAMD00019534_050370 [Acytostelium subglobosum LB1]GAM21862.1 hypothetical protein SAMD00019534_050370 [Acytostelium subglobosum LB1]|eukprot:XP_012754962.1 hypothetical protein SAMD00019534_050370 [Acytostelium subglobosum LB1]